MNRGVVAGGIVGITIIRIACIHIDEACGWRLDNNGTHGAVGDIARGAKAGQPYRVGGGGREGHQRRMIVILLCHRERDIDIRRRIVVHDSHIDSFRGVQIA